MAALCGTTAAYHRHKYYGEPVCDPCREAYNRQKRERTWKKGIHRPQRPPRHATQSMYVAGCRCPSCKRAHADYMVDWRAGVSRSDRRPKVTIVEVVLDVLETWWPESMPTDLLIDRVVTLHPEWKRESVRRVLVRDVFRTGEVERVDGRWMFRGGGV